MAREIRQYTLSIPAGTTAAAPLVQDVTFPPRRVDGLQVIVPPGPSGLVGWAVLNGGVRVIPYLSDLWIITAGETISWPLEGMTDSGAWQVAGYNTGTVSHVVYFRFLLSLVDAPIRPGPAMIDDALLSTVSIADTGQDGG